MEVGCMEPPRRWCGSTGLRRPEQPVQACGATDDKDLRKCRMLPLRDGSRLTTMIIQPRAVYAPRPNGLSSAAPSSRPVHDYGPPERAPRRARVRTRRLPAPRSNGLGRRTLAIATVRAGFATRVLRIRGEHIRYPGLTRGRLVWRGVDDDRLVSGRGMEVFDQVPPG